ncbi:MAG: DNA-3-methyladenine glycosylase 2 family protein [Acidobacteria bacterium]|nr:DNA-3-methyladenine glycosylase 2 family protein [Acidobacteriota bacterium]MBV9145756.1 DNA-3-methyladenine glycosylase 2 family protein [Acidobacteriota bacterium]MBV9435890.1 DNA-3-methyladenine glycosylase 2 family protein [Acidobacteriota bacterium]
MRWKGGDLQSIRLKSAATKKAPSNSLGFEYSPETALAHLRGADPVLARVIERVGAYAMQYREPTFPALVRSIVFQQLHGNAARAIYERLEKKAGGRVTPESILKLRPAQMRAIGLSKQKLTYIRDLARKTRDGVVEFGKFPKMTDEEVIAELTQVKGIGEWTAHMFLMFALRRPNILPTGDFGVRSAMRKAYGMKVMPKPRTMERIARCWHPYCSIASWYMWRSLDVPVEL